MLMIATFTINAVFNLIIGLLIAKYLGPSDFGRYALAQSIGIFLNTILLDWLRHAATRFYMDNDPKSGAVRATLDATLAMCCLVIAALSAIVILLGFDFGLGLWLAAVAPLIGIVNGLFDVQTALLRARFRDRPYAAAIILKNLFSLVLVVGSAAWFRNPAVTLFALSLSMTASLLTMRRSLADREAKFSLANLPQARIFAIYALPIVIGSIFWQLMPLFNRSLLADAAGFEISGQYSLGYDLGIKIVGAIGSALEILLLQLAIKADHQHGAEAAKEQLALNMVIVFAVMAPVCAGLWLVMPSFELLFVPLAFHGSFGRILGAMLPGLFAFAVLSYSIHQVFFVARKTWPLLFSSLIALVVNVALVLLRRTVDPVEIAFIQGLGFIASLLTGIALAARIFPVRPRWRDTALVLLGTALMAAAVYPLQAMEPGMVTMALSVVVGVVVVGAVMLAGDVAGVRKQMLALRK